MAAIAKSGAMFNRESVIDPELAAGASSNESRVSACLAGRSAEGVDPPEAGVVASMESSRSPVKAFGDITRGDWAVPAGDLDSQSVDARSSDDDRIAKLGHQALVEGEVVKSEQSGSEHFVRDEQVSKIGP